jgi:hypothetical protein
MRGRPFERAPLPCGGHEAVEAGQVRALREHRVEPGVDQVARPVDVRHARDAELAADHDRQRAQGGFPAQLGDQPLAVGVAVAVDRADDQQVRPVAQAPGDDEVVRRARAEVGHVVAVLLQQ